MIGSKLLRIALVAGAAMVAWASAGAAQENVCAAADQRQACSFQCCGRRSCPPSCEVDCVKRCVDACSSRRDRWNTAPASASCNCAAATRARASRARVLAHGNPRAAARSTSSRPPLSSRGMIMTDLSHAPETPELRTERLIDGLLRGIFIIRIPLAMGILSLLVLTLSDQVLEVHRVLTQERAQDVFNVHWLLALASLVALSLVLWQMARQHAEFAAEDVPGEHVVSHPLCTWVLRWGPRLVATLPLLGAALGIWLSRLPNLDGADMPASLAGPLKIIAQLRTDFVIGSLICIALAAVVFIVITVFERSLTPHGSSRARKLAIFSNWMLFPLIILASIVLLVRDPVHLPQTLRVDPAVRAVDGQSRRADGTVRALLSHLRRADPGRAGHPAHRLRGVRPHRQPPVPLQAGGHPAPDDRDRVQVLARRAQGRPGLSQRCQALSRLCRGGRGRRALCGLPDGQVPRAHAGPLSRTSPSTCSRSARSPAAASARRCSPA